MSDIENNQTQENSNKQEIPYWEYKGIKYPLYPVDELQCAVTEVIDPSTEDVLGFVSHFFYWESDAPFNAHQRSLVMREEKLPGKAGTRESNPDIIGADSELYVELIHSGEYIDNKKDAVPVKFTREQMLEMFGDERREDRSRAIREFFDVTIDAIAPDYQTGLDLLKNNDGKRKYAVKIGNPLSPVAVIVISMNKSDTQSRTNYEAAIRESIDKRKGDLPVTETTYNLQAQTNFGKKFFFTVENGAAFKGKRFDPDAIENSDEKAKYIAEFMSKFCPKWWALLGDRHYSSAARTQGKS